MGCSSNPDERCGNGLEKVYPTAAVRYGHMKHIGEFKYKPGMKFTCGAKVVVQTTRGIEIGDQVSLTCTGCSKSISREQMRDYAKLSGEGYLDLNVGKILREATVEDLHEDRRIRLQAEEKLRLCRSLVATHSLPMKMIDCEHLFGGERIIFYFMSEGRVDFRELVKDLAREYHTRIEMRQIGARDEARLVADFETCGQECCCKTFLKTLKPISMKMAKMQKATLDPSKVSGRCGRLKCCLRYEHETYEELDKKLPKLGRFIRTQHGDGTVVDRQILTQLIQLEQEGGRRITVVVEDILPADPAAKSPAPPPARVGREGPADEPSEPAAPAAQAGEPQEPRGEAAPLDRKKRRRRRRSRRSDDTPPRDPGQAAGE